MKSKSFNVEPFPKIPRLSFRSFAGKGDYPKMLAVIEAATKIDQDERSITLEDLTHDYDHLINSDPMQDMLFAEVAGEIVAYSRTEWYQEENPNDRIYSHFINIKPAFRNQGIEIAMIRWCENHLREIASHHPHDSKRFLQTSSNEFKQDFNQILAAEGYEPIRYSYEMSRILDKIPKSELPDGIEVRPVNEKDCYKIWQASIEAFRDHWGFSEPTEEDYLKYKRSKFFQPNLWQVAWDGDQVVASILNYIDHDYNRKFNKKRGWTEEITTRRKWRRRGIAKALLSRSMQLHKAKGMKEVALGVDTENPSGALQLYQTLGYTKDKTWITYRKPL